MHASATTLPFILLTIISIISLSACGVDKDGTHSSKNSYSTTSSSSQSSTSSATQTNTGYSILPSGDDRLSYESVDLSVFSTLDRQAAQVEFKQSLYQRLLDYQCQDCHSSASQAQAPLIADGDLSLAMNHALTQINFHTPQHSKLVEITRIYRHHCFTPGCKSIGVELTEAIEAWKPFVVNALPQPHIDSPQDAQIEDSTINNWIEIDRALLDKDDLPFMVYTSLHKLQNKKLNTRQLNIVRVALSKALNSTARWAPEIVNPTDVTGQGILYRFDIRNYWGYNQGVTELFFGGTDEDLPFATGKRDYLGNYVNASTANKKYNFTGETEKDPKHALLTWGRILHGNVEGFAGTGTVPPNISGFVGKRSTNASGEYVALEDFKWVEATQLVYTLSRPDVYNAIMMNPFYADELEENLQLDTRQGIDSYDYLLTQDAQSIDSRLTLRADLPNNGYFYKNFAIITGHLNSGEDRSIYDVYADPDGKDIRFPFWANPIPKFVKWLSVQDDNVHYSFVASLAQVINEDTAIDPFTSANTPGCNPQFEGIGLVFGLCQNYTGTGGAQQSMSQILYSLANGLQGYYVAGGFNQRRVDMYTNIARDPRRIPEAEDDIAYRTGYNFGITNVTGQSPPAVNAVPRLIVGESCFGCHADGIRRTNNDLRHWLDTDSSLLPSGGNGVNQWIDDPDITHKVRELYPPNHAINRLMEQDRLRYLKAMANIKNTMIRGEDKNLYVEPIIWTAEYARDTLYGYDIVAAN